MMPSIEALMARRLEAIGARELRRYERIEAGPPRGWALFIDYA